MPTIGVTVQHARGICRNNCIFEKGLLTVASLGGTDVMTCTDLDPAAKMSTYCSTHAFRPLEMCWAAFLVLYCTKMWGFENVCHRMRSYEPSLACTDTHDWAISSSSWRLSPFVSVFLCSSGTFPYIHMSHPSARAKQDFMHSNINAATSVGS